MKSYQGKNNKLSKMSDLTFTIIQTNLHWEEPTQNLKMLEEKIKGIKEKTEVIILPEMFTTGFSMKPEQFAEGMEGETIKWMKCISSERKIILTGSIMTADKGNYYNRLIWMLPNGRRGIYDKKHLFGYADEDKHYTSGTKRLIASVKGWKINLLVCYDLRFPVWSRQSYRHDDNNGLEYDILVYVANWPESRNHMWKTLLQARAIENQCFCIGVNRVGNDGNGIYYSGDSMLINPLGEVLYQKAHEEDVYTFTLQKEELEKIREKMPFWKDADAYRLLQN